jgi:hypothetical protein
MGDRQSLNNQILTQWAIANQQQQDEAIARALTESVSQGRVIRIGSRDPITGLWGVIDEDGVELPIGIKTFNQALPPGTPVRAIPLEGGLYSLDYGNLRTQEESIVSGYEICAVFSLIDVPGDPEIGNFIRASRARWYMKRSNQSPFLICDVYENGDGLGQPENSAFVSYFPPPGSSGSGIITLPLSTRSYLHSFSVLSGSLAIAQISFYQFGEFPQEEGGSSSTGERQYIDTYLIRESSSTFIHRKYLSFPNYAAGNPGDSGYLPRERTRATPMTTFVAPSFPFASPYPPELLPYINWLPYFREYYSANELFTSSSNLTPLYARKDQPFWPQAVIPEAVEDVWSLTATNPAASTPDLFPDFGAGSSYQHRMLNYDNTLTPIAVTTEPNFVPVFPDAGDSLINTFPALNTQALFSNGTFHLYRKGAVGGVFQFIEAQTFQIRLDDWAIAGIPATYYSFGLRAFSAEMHTLAEVYGEPELIRSSVNIDTVSTFFSSEEFDPVGQGFCDRIAVRIEAVKGYAI